MSRSIWVQMRFVAFSLWGHPYHDFSLIRRPPCVWAPLFGSNMWNPSRSVYSDEVFLVTSERPQYYQQSALWLCLKTNISMFVEQQLESRWISFFPGREVSAFLSTSLKPREKTPMGWNHPNRNAEGLGAICAYVLVALVVSVAPVGNLDVWGSWQLRCWMAHIVLLILFGLVDIWTSNLCMSRICSRLKRRADYRDMIMSAQADILLTFLPLELGYQYQRPDCLMCNPRPARLQMVQIDHRNWKLHTIPTSSINLYKKPSVHHPISTSFFSFWRFPCLLFDGGRIFFYGKKQWNEKQHQHQM